MILFQREENNRAWDYPKSGVGFQTSFIVKQSLGKPDEIKTRAYKSEKKAGLLARAPVDDRDKGSTNWTLLRHFGHEKIRGSS